MIAILDYGVGNLFSLKSSLTMLGEDACLTGEAAALRRDRLLIPADHHHGRDAPGGDAGPGGRYPGPGEDICGRRAHQPELLR